jgi:hypothetical protein
LYIAPQFIAGLLLSLYLASSFTGGCFSPLELKRFSLSRQG